jgi:uncharacterized protein
MRRCQRDDEYACSPPANVDKKSTDIADARKLARRGLRIGRTNVGKGVFATRKIVDGTCIGEIEGQIIHDASYESRYSFDLDNGNQLEPAPPFRYVNHSCEPNCAFELISVSPELDSCSLPGKHNETVKLHRKLLLFAICDIDIGDELSIDYNWPATFAIRCQCKAPSCRGWIVNPKHLVPLD